MDDLRIGYLSDIEALANSRIIHKIIYGDDIDLDPDELYLYSRYALTAVYNIKMGQKHTYKGSRTDIWTILHDD